MKLTNIIVTFTVTIPEIEVDKDLGLGIARDKLRRQAEMLIDNSDFMEGVESHIKDCPDYPALCD